MSDRIKYDFGGLAMLSDQMKQQAKAINDKQGDIKVVVDKLQAGWEGAGSEAWNDAQRRWAQASEELNMVLAQIAGAMASGSEKMQEADRIAANGFGR
jgi:6 kDa early secretory antigenic target